MKKAWLHMRHSREGFRIWTFEMPKTLYICTQKKHEYYIMWDDAFNITIEDENNKDCTSKLRCTKIEFENGAEYIFPGRR